MIINKSDLVGDEGAINIFWNEILLDHESGQRSVVELADAELAERFFEYCYYAGLSGASQSASQLFSLNQFFDVLAANKAIFGADWLFAQQEDNGFRYLWAILCDFDDPDSGEEYSARIAASARKRFFEIYANEIFEAEDEVQKRELLHLFAKVANPNFTVNFRFPDQEDMFEDASLSPETLDECIAAMVPHLTQDNQIALWQLSWREFPAVINCFGEEEVPDCMHRLYESIPTAHLLDAAGFARSVFEAAVDDYGRCTGFKYTPYVEFFCGVLRAARGVEQHNRSATVTLQQLYTYSLDHIALSIYESRHRNRDHSVVVQLLNVILHKAYPDHNGGQPYDYVFRLAEVLVRKVGVGEAALDVLMRYKEYELLRTLEGERRVLTKLLGSGAYSQAADLGRNYQAMLHKLRTALKKRKLRGDEAETQEMESQEVVDVTQQEYRGRITRSRSTAAAAAASIGVTAGPRRSKRRCSEAADTDVRTDSTAGPADRADGHKRCKR